MNLENFNWIRKPRDYKIENNNLIINTQKNTDLWQNTYYHFKNDNAPLFQYKTKEKYFTFTVKVNFDYKHRFDQCGVVMYLNSENWLKASIEYQNEEYQQLGCVVTNNAYSDWSTSNVESNIKEMWYRLSRREADFKIECSCDGINYEQLRITHMFNVKEEISFGVYACSPEDSSFECVFSNFKLSKCLWLDHDGQQPD